MNIIGQKPDDTAYSVGRRSTLLPLTTGKGAIVGAELASNLDTGAGMSLQGTMLNDRSAPAIVIQGVRFAFQTLEEAKSRKELAGIPFEWKDGWLHEFIKALQEKKQILSHIPMSQGAWTDRFPKYILVARPNDKEKVFFPDSQMQDALVDVTKHLQPIHTIVLR